MFNEQQRKKLDEFHDGLSESEKKHIDGVVKKAYGTRTAKELRERPCPKCGGDAGDGNHYIGMTSVFCLK